MSISNYLETKIITDNLITVAAYVSLHTADPGETGTSELTGGSYVRKLAGLGAPSNGVSTNGSDILWTGMPAATITHVSLWDAVSGGNCLWTGALTASKTLGAGDEFKLPASNLTVTID